jgi:hypothetical protein
VQSPILGKQVVDFVRNLKKKNIPYVQKKIFLKINIFFAILAQSIKF